MEGMMREKLRLKSIVNQATLETMAEGDVIVPDVKPDVGQVLAVEGMAMVHKTEALKDRVNISGNVVFTVLYRPEEENLPVKSLRVTQPFYHTEELSGVRADMALETEAMVDHAACTLIHSRKVSLKAIVRMEVRVCREEEPEIVTDLEEPDVEKCFQTLETQRLLGSLSETLPVRETLEIPPGCPSIGELLWVQPKIMGKDMKVMQNKVFIKGELVLSSVYLGEMEDDGLCTAEHTIPFTEVFPIEGVTEDADCEMQCGFEDFHADEAEDDDGDLRRLSLDAVLSIQLTVTRRTQMEVLSDAYHTKGELELSRETLPMERVMGCFSENITLKDSIRLPEDAPLMDELLNARAEPYFTDISESDGKICANGAVSVFYCAKTAEKERPVYYGKGEVPFTYSCDCGKGEEIKPEVRAEILQNQVTLSGTRELDLKCTLAVKSKAVCPGGSDIITDARLSEDNGDEEELPSIIICYVRPGDGLWAIAKRYKTTEEEIMSLNDTVDFDHLKPGQQLFIPR